MDEGLTTGKVMAAERPMSDPYDSYGTEVPCIIAGSKQYWKSFGYDLVTMTEQLGKYLTFMTCPLMITGLIYNPPSEKDGGLVQIPQSFKTYHASLTMNRHAVGPNPLESILGAEKHFSAMMDILLDKKS